MPIGDKINRTGITRRKTRNVIDDYYDFQGGLIIEPNPKSIPPGALLGVKNYYPDIWGGYRRVAGYERYDGRTKISETDFFAVEFTYTNATSFIVGETITFTGSGALGTTIAVLNDATPAIGVTGWLVFRIVTGTPADTDTLSGGTSGGAADADSDLLTNVAPTAQYELEWRNATQDDYRSTITAVPGEGDVKGVFVFDGELFAFRKKSGQDEDGFYRATTTGWTEITLGTKVYFTNGTIEPTEGSFVRGFGGALAAVQRVVVNQGTWDAGDAEGYFVADEVNGTFNAGEDVTSYTPLGGSGDKLFEIPGILIRFDVGETEIRALDSISGVDSGASCTVRSVVVESGSWGDNTARGYFTTDAVTSGPFTAGEELRVSLARVAETEGVRVYFQEGSTEMLNTNEIVGATSGATITAGNNVRIVQVGGDWAESNAFGYIVCKAVTVATFIQDEDLNVTGGGSNPVAKTIPDGGPTFQLTVQDGTVKTQVDQTLGLGVEYHFIGHNFGGHTKTNRMYGVNGAGRAFEFENNPGLWTWAGVFTEIETGMENDAPVNIEQFNNHLILAFTGGSIQVSGLNEPLVFNPIVGADEKNIGDEVTNMHSDKQNALFITGRNSTWVLYGEVRENFQLVEFTEETGGISNTMQRLGKVWYIDDIGVTDLEATDRYGNFLSGSSTAAFNTRFINRLRSSTIKASHISRRRQLVEWHFADGVTVVMGVRAGGKEGTMQPIGFTEVQYGKTITCATSEELGNDSGVANEERIFLGASDGYVYEMDSGSYNFDGDEIEAFLRFSYHYSKQPDQNKNYRRASFDLDATGVATIEISADFDWGERAGIQSQVISVEGSLGFWDISNWGEFVFGGSAFQRPLVTLGSEGNSIGWFVYHKSELEPDHSVKGVTVQWSPTRTERGAYRGN